jgi:hypothetical protein
MPRGAGAVAGFAGTDVVAALERITMIRPRMAGSDLRKARADAASAAADGVVAWEAADAGMGREGLGERTAALASPALTCRPDGWKRATRGHRIWLQRSERILEKGDQAGRGGNTAVVAMVARPLFLEIA